MKFRIKLLSKIVCGVYGNAPYFMNTIFGNLGEPQSYGLSNTLNLRIPLKSGKKTAFIEN